MTLSGLFFKLVEASWSRRGLLKYPFFRTWTETRESVEILDSVTRSKERWNVLHGNEKSRRKLDLCSCGRKTESHTDYFFSGDGH